MTETKQARKVRRIVVYSVASVVFSGIFLGLLYGLKPMLLPLVLGTFLAYLFKPLAKSFRGSTVSKYLRAGALLYAIGFLLYWCFSIIKTSMPNDIEKLQLKVRLKYKFTERYESWMGLKDGGKGNAIYGYLGAELDQIKAKAIENVTLTDDEKTAFLLYHEGTSKNDPFAAKNFDEDAARYYEYFLVNNKTRKVTEENSKLKSKSKNKEPIVEAIPQPEEPPKNTIGSIMTAFSHWIILPLAFIFILLDKGQIIHFFMKLIPNRYFELTYTILEKVDEALGKYIRGTMIECALVGLTLIVGFYLCGIQIKIAVIIGIIGGLTNAIPFVGTFLACAIGIVYSLIAENIHPILPFVNADNLMIAVVGVVVVAHLLDNAIFQPLVVGSAVNLHPLVIILGVFGGSLMFGFAGLIFAIPTIVILKVVTETFFSGLKDYRII